ncbi:hypothetical protein BHYA_0078g00230 [Botrytis hyacinthi]|uniref:Uncharacterized protein n=1 Tax=Botrytis hyacinthi TaxID=278943 RepID=A0A4Z1GTR2_9HELO|nr:hypothetical protein BHYA_0078g00230 [Botrytis hyacinthi]
MSMLPPKTDKTFTDDERNIINLWEDYLKKEFPSWFYQEEEEDEVVEEIFRLVGKGLNSSALISSAYKNIPQGPRRPDSDRVFIVNKARRFFGKYLRKWSSVAADNVAAERELIDEITAELGASLDISTIGYHYLKYKKSSYEDFVVTEWAEHWKTNYDTNREREDANKYVVSKLKYFFRNATSEQAIRNHYMRERPQDERRYPTKPRKTLEERRRAPSSGPRHLR